MRGSLSIGPSGELERIGTWDVRGVLGRGGMGVVYEVVGPGGSGPFALKTVERRFLDVADPAAEQRFMHEIRVLEQLDHPGVVRLHEFGMADHPLGYPLAYYVMERLFGDTLVPTIKAGLTLPLGESLRIVRALVDALAHLERHGVLHRDLKPGNIFLERTGRVVLLDFGLARSEELTRLTLAGQIVGTFSYMAPERLAGLPLGVEADVFSMGVVLFQLLAARHPFGSGSPPELMAAIHRGIAWRDDDPPVLREPRLRALLTDVLAVRPERRPRPGEVLRRLDAWSEAPRPPAPEGGTELISVDRDERRLGPRTPREPVPASPLSGPSPVTVFPLASKPPAPSAIEVTAPAAPAVSLAGTRGPSWVLFGLACGSLLCLGFAVGLVLGSRRGRAHEPERGATALMAGLRALEGGRLEQAERELRQALREAPDLAEVHRALSDVAAARGDARTAAAACARYLEQRPEAPDRAVCLARMGP